VLPTNDECCDDVVAAMTPCAWRALTDRMVGQLVIGAVDRHSVTNFLVTVPGTSVGDASPVEPAEAGDERVEVLRRALEGQHWRAWSLARLCAYLLGSLTAWQSARESSHADPRTDRP
jgi:hypothetical protein